MFYDCCLILATVKPFSSFFFFADGQHPLPTRSVDVTSLFRGRLIGDGERIARVSLTPCVVRGLF